MPLDPSVLAKAIPTRSNRKKMTWTTLVFCAAVIGYIVIKGDPTNQLQVTALEYSYMLAGGVVFGYSASAVADTATIFKGKKVDN